MCWKGRAWAGACSHVEYVRPTRQPRFATSSMGTSPDSGQPSSLVSSTLRPTVPGSRCWRQLKPPSAFSPTPLQWNATASTAKCRKAPKGLSIHPLHAQSLSSCGRKIKCHPNYRTLQRSNSCKNPFKTMNYFNSAICKRFVGMEAGIIKVSS